MLGDLVEVLEVAGLVLVIAYLLSHARNTGKKGGCGCSDGGSSKATDNATPNGGPCS